MLIYLLTGVFALAAIILLIVTISLLLLKKKKFACSKACSGTIIDIQTEYRMGKKYIWPVVSYVVDGVEYVFNGSYFSTSMNIGDHVDVLYDVNDHKKASIKTGLSFAPMVTGILMAAFMIASVVCVVLISNGIV